MPRPERPKNLGRFVAGGSLASETVTWRLAESDDPVEVALAALQRRLLHDLPHEFDVTDHALAELVGVARQHLAPLLDGTRAVETEHVLRLLMAFDKNLHDVSLSEASGAEGLLPAVYRGWLRRDRLPGVARLQRPSTPLHWVSIIEHVAGTLAEHIARSDLHLADDTLVLLAVAEAISVVGGWSPRTADRAFARGSASAQYQGREDLTLTAALLHRHPTRDRLSRFVGDLCAPTPASHVSLVVLDEDAIARLTSLFPSLTTMRQAGDAAGADEQDLEAVGIVNPPAVPASAEFLLHASASAGDGYTIQAIETTKTTVVALGSPDG